MRRLKYIFNPLNGELNPICHLLAGVGAHHIIHVSRVRVEVTVRSVGCNGVVVSKRGLVAGCFGGRNFCFR